MTTRTQYYAATSIDGFLADAEHGLDWLLQFDFAEFQARYDAFFARVGAIVMGARTYEFILGQGDEAWTYGDLPCWVLSHREQPVPAAADVRFFAGDAREAHAAAVAAAAGGNVWVLGGGDVAAQLARHELIDDLIVTIVPVLLGSGMPLHPGVAVTRPLRLVDTHRFDSGAIELVYDLRA